MPEKKYIIRLSASERTELQQLIKTGKVAAHKRLHAQILLKADVGDEGPGWNDKAIAGLLDVGRRTVERTRQRVVEKGLVNALERTPRTRSKSPRLDGEQEAHLVALTCGEPPAGRSRWTLKLLAEHMVALDYVGSVCPETIRKVLKKRHQTLAT